MTLHSHPPTSTKGAVGRRRSLILLIAFLAAAAMMVTMPKPAQAAEVCTGSGCDTVAFVDSNAIFSIYQDLVPSSPVGSFYFGNPKDEPLMGDWDCDGDQTPAMYRRSAGSMYLRNSNTQGIADRSFWFGIPGDVPLVGDFDGDGCDTMAIYRPSQAKFYLSDELGNVTADRVFYYGDFGDTPIVGDWNGDGVDTIGVYRASTGLIALRNSNTPGAPDRTFYFGDPHDKVIVGDWDGDGVDTIAVYRPSTGVLHITNSNRSGVASYTFYGPRNRIPVAASGITSVPNATVIVPGFEPPPPRSSSGPIRASGNNVVIQNVHVSNPGGDCISVTNGSNVTIKNVTVGPCGGDAIYLSDVTNASVTGNYITDSERGVLVHRSDSVRVDSNTFINTGRNFVQFDKVNGANSSISGNRGQNELGGSNAEDLISLFTSNGTSASPIRIVGNHLRNGGPSHSGSGILLGDGGGAHQLVEGNVLVNPGQIGIGIASGTDVTVRNNLIYGDALGWSNVGMYVWNQYGNCGSIEVVGNQIDWRASGGYRNGFFNGGGCDAYIHDNNWNANLGPGIF
jgi:parallel beta-helix repeat protein